MPESPPLEATLSVPTILDRLTIRDCHSLDRHPSRETGVALTRRYGRPQFLHPDAA